MYHAGTGRSVFLGCLRVTTIFIFSFFCLVVAPSHFYAEDEPKWVAAAGKPFLSFPFPSHDTDSISRAHTNYPSIRMEPCYDR